MNFKKRVNGSWTDTPNYIHKTDTDTITTLPAVLYPTGATATVGLKGQTTQSSIPSPTSPVMPEGTGERTGNLAPYLTEWVDGYINSSGTISTAGSDTKEKSSDYIELHDEQIITFSYPNGFPHTTATNAWRVIAFYKSDKTFLTRIGGAGDITALTASVPENAKYARLSMRNYGWTGNTMLNTGSTALPYEPYGYKIPISSGGVTTTEYLGEVQSTRQIYKLVLTGQETGWNFNEPNNVFYLLAPNAMLIADSITSICTHYKAVGNKSLYINMSNNEVCIRANDTYLWIKDTTYSTVTDFKTYLQQQYAAGTPVTVWYVLAEPTTGVVNEPLRKIGTYADEVSGITIPTIAGANTLSVDTTLQPSEITVNYKGWHPVADVHVYPDSSWMPTSWEEFRKAVRSGKAQSLYPVGTKLYENWGDETSDAWIVVDYPTGEDYLDSDLAQQGYTNRVMLMEEKLNYLRQFDAIESWLYVETAIPAGTYRFTIPNYDATYGGNKTYIFTSTANVPVGGQLTLTWAYQQNPSAVQAYSSATSTSTLFNVSITEWDGTTACTDLGTIKLAQNDPDSTYGKLNHIHRARYGSNNYYQSGYRQWLNTNASANWWTPTNVFDRPYGNRTNAGRLNVMNSNMKSVLATPTVNCITNNLFEYPSLDGTTFSLQTVYTVKDKLFPVTHSEINLSSSPNVNSVLDYYVNKGNADRIKYRKDNGNAYYWWLRTPYPTYANGVRSVSTSGALSYSGASNTYGSAAACIIQ